MLNLKWNMTVKPDPTLEPSNYKQLPKNMHVFRSNFYVSTTV